MRQVAKIIAGVILSAHPTSAFAQSVVISDSGDTAWMLTASALALLAVLPGLMLLHAGRSSAAAALSAMVQCFAIVASVSLLWAVIGYSLAFGEGTALLGGIANLFLGGLAQIRDGLTVPESAFALFQMVLAVIAPALLAGAYAPRARLAWVVGFSLVWSLIVYVPVAHWLWGGGWLAALGAIDFAGGIAINLSVGVSALVLVKMFGARATRERPRPHAAALAIAGAGLLWIGWFGVAGGWALAATDDAAAAILNFHLATSSAGLAWMLAERLRDGRSSAWGFATGALAGIAAIASSAVYVAPSGAIAIGLAGSLLAFYAAGFVRRWLRADDPLNLFAVHAVGGLAGALLLAGFVFPVLGGPGLQGDDTIASLFVAQGVAVVAVAIWSVIGTLVAGFGVAMVFPMQVPAEEEGADAAERAWEIG